MALDILQFVDSPDVRQYMRSIGYQPSTPEAAFLVWHCNAATLEERFAAWEQIIATMPNCGYETKRLQIEIPDFHKFLRQYMALQKRLLEDFKKPNGCLYVYGVRTRFHASDEGSELYSTFESCVAAAVEDAMDVGRFTSSYYECSEMRPAGSFRSDVYERFIVKRQIDDEKEGGEDECTINANGDVLEIDCCSGLSSYEPNLDTAFREMLFKFPLPFRTGDILFDWHRGGAPYVLTEVRLGGTEQKRRGALPLELREDYVEAADKDLARYLAQGGAEHIDGFGYALEECCDGEPYVWVDNLGMHDMLNAAYCDRPLSGRYRLLKPVSEYLKGNSNIGAVVNVVVTLTQQMGAESRVDMFRSEYAPKLVADFGFTEEPRDGQRRVRECLNRTDCLFITAAVPGQPEQRACEQRQLLRTEIEQSGLMHFRAKGKYTAASADDDAAEVEVFIVANSRFSPLDFITLAAHWCGMFNQKQVLVTCPEHAFAEESYGKEQVEAKANFYDAQRDVLASHPYVLGETPCDYFVSILGKDFMLTGPWQLWKDDSECRYGVTNLMAMYCAYDAFKKCYPKPEACMWKPYNHKPAPDGACPRHLFEGVER